MDISEQRIIPVVKISNTNDTIPLLNAIYGGGISICEITYRTACAEAAIETAVKAFPKMAIGAGTVVNVLQAQRALDLGVQFIVSPGFDEKTAEICLKNGVSYFGGAVTPYEIMKVMSFGLDTVKFFPSEAMGGLKTVKALSQPFPSLKFMPTGGISIKNLAEYLSFDKVAACGGSWMVADELIKNRDFKTITTLCKEAYNESRNVR